MIFSDEYFLKDFAEQQGMSKEEEYYAWTYALNSTYLPQHAGFVKRYTKSNLKIDFITVKVSKLYIYIHIYLV